MNFGKKEAVKPFLKLMPIRCLKRIDRFIDGICFLKLGLILDDKHLYD